MFLSNYDGVVEVDHPQAVSGAMGIIALPT